jgi:hypothetical protein
LLRLKRRRRRWVRAKVCPWGSGSNDDACICRLGNNRMRLRKNPPSSHFKLRPYESSER